MIELALADVSANYGFVGGGGISEIAQLATLRYRVSLPQEERVDVFTYEFAIDGKGRISIAKRQESTDSKPSRSAATSSSQTVPVE